MNMESLKLIYIYIYIYETHLIEIDKIEREAGVYIPTQNELDVSGIVSSDEMKTA